MRRSCWRSPTSTSSTAGSRSWTPPPSRSAWTIRSRSSSSTSCKRATSAGPSRARRSVRLSSERTNGRSLMASDPDEVLLESTEKMEKAVGHVQADFASVRTGRASPALVERIKVDYYGTEVPLQQIAGFNVPEARLLVIQPYDKNAMKDIEKAIQSSDLGINPS